MEVNKRLHGDSLEVLLMPSHTVKKKVKRYSLARVSSSPTATAKRDIQEYVRQIVILRDGGCIYRGVKGLPPCNGYAGEDNHLVLQADHLISRGKNIGFADTRLIVCVCKGHHTAKTFDHSGVYEPIARELIGKTRAELWDKVKADGGNYPMGYSDWLICIAALKQELSALEAL